MNKVITPEGIRTLEEKDLNEARSLLNDENKLPEFQEIFRQNAGSNLLNLSSEIEQINPEPLICIDGSQTKPEFNGKIKTTYISAISANGLIPIPGLIHKDETQRIQTTDNRKSGRLVDLVRSDLEFKVICDIGSKNPYLMVADGSLTHLYLCIQEMMQLSDEYEFSHLNEENLEILISLIVHMQLIGVTKDTSCTCPEDYIYSEIPGINLIHHNEICNFLLKPGDLLIDRPNFILREITRFKGIDNSTIKRVNKLYEIVKEIKTYTYKPRNGTGTVVRFQMYGRDKNKLLQTLNNLDFDKTGTVVEPWCQLKADKDAVSAASIRKSKWEAASFSNSDANNLKLEKTAPTRLVNRNLHRR